MGGGFTGPAGVEEGMSEGHEALRSTLEEMGYTVDDVTTNRDKIRVALREDDAEADLLREAVNEAVGAENVFALDVSTESVDGGGTVQTVVSFRDRS